MSDCIFCKIVSGEARSWKVYENERVYAFLDIHPVNEYHTLVIPKAPARNIFDISAEDLAHVARGAHRIARAAQQAFQADGMISI